MKLIFGKIKEKYNRTVYFSLIFSQPLKRKRSAFPTHGHKICFEEINVLSCWFNKKKKTFLITIKITISSGQNWRQILNT